MMTAQAATLARLPNPAPPAPVVAAARGSRVEVSLFEGPPVRGSVGLFNPRSPQFLLHREGTDARARQVVPFERVRHVAFLGNAPPDGMTISAAYRVVRLRLLDGTEVEGLSHSWGGLRQGIFLRPIGRRGVERLYVPASAVSEVAAVQDLGALLRGRKYATIEMVETALAEQRARAAARPEPAPPAPPPPKTSSARTAVRLGEILVSQGAITLQELGHALAAQAGRAGRRLGELLVELGIASHKMVAIGLAAQHGIPYLTLRGHPVDPALRNLLPAELARRYQAMPVQHAAGQLTVAVADPGEPTFAAALRDATGLAITPAVATPQDIAGAIRELYGAAS
jgi:Type II secretion system (T2SS), protein E, N-terminal domain